MVRMKAIGMAAATLFYWTVSFSPARAEHPGGDPSKPVSAQVGSVHGTAHQAPSSHHKPPGSGAPSVAEIFACGNGIIGLQNDRCGHMYASMLVMGNGDAAGVVVPQVQPFTFNSSNGATFTFDVLGHFCPANFGVIFQGKRNGAAATVGACVCNATSRPTGCSENSTRYTFDAGQFPSLNGLTVSSIMLVLYGGGAGSSASAYDMQINGFAAAAGFNTNPIQCPTLPADPCGQ